MATKKIKWVKKIEPIPAKLQQYGKVYYDRFTDEKQSTLHKPQKDALKALVKWFSDEDTKNMTAVVVMPTGTGKTGVICCLPYSLMGTNCIPEKLIKKPVLIIAPGITILHQLKENLLGSENVKSFLERIGFLDEEDIEKQANYSVHVIEKTEQVKNITQYCQNDIILSNSQKWRKKKSADYANYEELPNDLFSMVIVDEAHHLPAKQWAEIVNKFKKNAKIIFFTATPDRADGRPITNDLISTNAYAYKLTRETAIKQKLIRDVSIKEERFEESDDTTSPASKRMRLQDIDTRQNCIKIVLDTMKECLRNKNRDYPLPGGKQHASIIIAKDIDEAGIVNEICIEQLDFDSSKVKVVHSAIIKTCEQQAAIIKDIKDGCFEVVIVVQMLLEGFDYPPFSIAGIVTRIRSPVKFAQFVGRIQRVVRHIDADDNETTEDPTICGDLITHEYFEQGKLIKDEFVTPLIYEEESMNIDEDYVENDEN